MNQCKADVLCSCLCLYDVVTDSALSGFASDPPGSCFSACLFACAVPGAEAADPRPFGRGRCK
jgi:hypothetical protein